MLRKLVSAAVPVAVALAAFLHAHAIGALIDASMSLAPAAIAPFAEARAASAPGPKTASAILERNPFDHTTALVRAATPGSAATDVDLSDPMSAPICDDVRARITVQSQDTATSFASLDVGGKHALRRQGQHGDDLRLVFVGEDRVWIERGGKVCQALVFGGDTKQPESPTAPPVAQTALEKAIAGKIEKTGPTSYVIDRGAVDTILQAQAELMKTPLVPEKEGDRVVGLRLARVKPGSVLATLGLAVNDRLVSLDGVDVTSMEGMMQAYAKLSTGSLDHMTIHLVRAGKPLNMDYTVK